MIVYMFLFSVSDPLNFDMDPDTDPRIRFVEIIDFCENFP